MLIKIERNYRGEFEEEKHEEQLLKIWPNFKKTDNAGYQL